MTVSAFIESNGNGHPNPYDEVFNLKREWSADEAKSARRRLHVAESTYRLRQLAASAKMLESIQCGDWWTSAAYDRVDRLRSDPFWRSAGTGRHDRKGGRNYPFFQTEVELGLFRMQSRILAGSNAYAVGLIEGVTSYTAGDGMTFRAVSKKKEQPAPKELLAAIQDIIDQHLERNHWHGGGQPCMEEELIGRDMVDGEWFLDHLTDNEGWTSLRIIEPEYVTQPLGGPEEYWGGILTPEGDVAGERLEYNVRWSETEEDTTIKADRIIHFRRNVVRNIKRGLPDFTYDTLDAFHVASRLRHNMALGAAIQATFAGIREHDTATKAQVESMVSAVANFTRTNPDTDQTEYIRKYEPGIAEMPAGSRFVAPPTAQNAAAHVEILRACLQGAGRRWLAPDWVIGGDASNNNLASSLVANDPFVIRIKRNQRDHKMVFRQSCWLAVRKRIEKRGAVQLRVKAKGVLSEQSFSLEQIEKLVDIQVEAPSPETRNKLEEAQVNQIYGMLRVKSNQTTQQELGLDTEQERINFEEQQEQMGPQGGALAMPGDQAGGAPAAPAAAPAAAPQLPKLESVQESVQDVPEVRLLSLAREYWREVVEG